MSNSFAATGRSDVVERLSNEHYDIVVIGGGVTGCGAVLDAASRGLKVALVEKDDFASGTSSKSSKLVHGGLRYLQSRDFFLVHEALTERQRLLKNAPHLVRELDFVIPIWGQRAFKRLISLGLWGYDVTGGFRIGKLHKPIDPERTLHEMPTLTSRNLTGGFFYPDAQTDDARLTMYIARTAAVRFGADIATYLAAEGIEKDASGRVVGVAVRDTLGGASTPLTIRARCVVNAGGVWSDAVRQLDEGRDPRMIRPAKGIHIAVPRALVQNQRAFVLPVPKDKRSIFVLPWGSIAWVGTTDTDYDGALDDPQATSEDIDYLLRALNHWVTTPVETSDVISSWAGLRPLVADATSERTADLSRRHTIISGSEGFVTITGGKLTTYRRMAEDTIDHVAETAVLPAGPCVTKRLQLDGGEGFDEQRLTLVFERQVGRESATSLVRRHGTNGLAVLQAAREDGALGDRIVPELPYIRAEIVHAIREENAQTVADVLERRIRLSIEHRSRGLDAIEDVLSVMRSELSWTGDRVSHERDAYRGRVHATFTAEAITAPPPELAAKK